MQIKIKQTKEKILGKASNVLDKWADTHPWGTIPRIPRQSDQGLILCINLWVQQCWDMYSVAISLKMLGLDIAGENKN